MSSPALPSEPWSTSRKVVAVVFAVAAYAALACTGLYLSGVFFLLLNKANPTQARLTSIIHYWQLYADEPALRKQLLGSMAAAGGGLLVVLPASLALAARPRRPLHGDARFATPAEVSRSGLTSGRQPGILVGRVKGQYLSLRGQLSVMLSAPTRTGKGVGVVIPNLLNWPHSVVVLDIKGENYDATAGYRAGQGQPVYFFSPFNTHALSHRWNPLTAVRSSPMHRVGDLLSIGQVFYPNDGKGSSSDAFFNDQARNLFLALGLLLLETPELPRTIGEMLRQASGKGRPLREHMNWLVAARESAQTPFTDECKEALQRVLCTSDNTMSSIVATFLAPLTIFTDAVVDATTSGDDFRLEDVRRRRMSIYLHVPANRLDSARPLMNLFVSQLINLNTEHLPQQDQTLKFQCLLINDEFTAPGRLGAIVTAAPFLAGYNLRLLTVVQAMSQLDSVYGDKEARTFATNHGLQILYAPREQRDAEEYSAMLGHFTELATSRGRSSSFGARGQSSVSRNESDQRRALLLPQEFKDLGQRRLVIILENCKPILADKICYHKEATFKSRLRRPPAVPRMDVNGYRNWVQSQWRTVAEQWKPPGDTEPIREPRQSPRGKDLDSKKERLADAMGDLFGNPDNAGSPKTPDADNPDRSVEKDRPPPDDGRRCPGDQT